MDETERWLESASKGDPVAVDALLDRYLPDLARYVSHRAGRVVSAKESPQDVVQSVCREVIEHLSDGRFEYRGEAQFKKWLYQAAMLKISQRRRFYLAERRDARREGPPVESSGEGEALFQRLASPSEGAMLVEQTERLRQAFERLPEEFREVIVLARVEGLSHREIAERMSISETHSRVLLSRALARLARLGAAEKHDS